MVSFITVLHILYPHDDTEMQPSLGKTAAANCRAAHREETLQSQQSRSRNSQAQQGQYKAMKPNPQRWAAKSKNSFIPFLLA